MSAAPLITQRDIAQACGVHPSTICLALKNSPSIPLATRRKVHAVADRMGYRPNVAARNLALLRGDRGSGGSLPIAWLNQEPQRQHWRTDPEARVVFEGAKSRAAALGYHLEEIWTREPGMTTSRLVQIVRARGIQGALFPVHHGFDPALTTPAWGEFALVGLNDRRLADWMDVVCPDYYRNVDLALWETRRMDGRSVGLAITARLDAASGGLIHSCFLRHQAEGADDERRPMCFLPDAGPGQESVFNAWLRRHQPEVVLCDDAALVRRAREAGVEVLWLGLMSAETPFDGGLDGGLAEVAGAAVECVVDKMRRFEHGMRDATRVHSLRCSWVTPQAARLAPVTGCTLCA